MKAFNFFTSGERAAEFLAVVLDLGHDAELRGATDGTCGWIVEIL